MKLTIDNRKANKGSHTEHVNATYDFANLLMNSLDGTNHTLLVLEREDKWQMMIGGGNERYVVTLSSQKDENYVLENLVANGKAEVELCAGGQVGYYPDNIVVDVCCAREAIGKFYSGLEAELAWS